MNLCSGMSEPTESRGQVRILTLSHPGERIDKALATELGEVSRSQCQRLIDDGLVTIEGKPVKASLRLEGGEQVTVVIPPVEEIELIAEPIPLDIRYEDKDIVIVNKPAGMVVHPSAGHERGTLVNALLAHCPDLSGVGGSRRPGIVHRLDKDTSGLIVVAKSDQSLRHLQLQFKERRVIKRYEALAEGFLTHRELKIDAAIGRDTRDRKKMAVAPQRQSATSREALTYVTLVSHYSDGAGGGFSFVECRPITGRTHQIRVHLAYAGHPIVGDVVYGRRKQRVLVSRHFLHAAGLAIHLPSDGTQLSIRAPLAPDLQATLEKLVPVA